jgi:hypothetical protein
MRKKFYTIIALLSLTPQFSFAANTKNLLLVEGGENSAQGNTNVGFEKDILPTIQDYLL